MYEKYTTKAFVLSFKNVKEADKIVSLYTKEYGLIKVLFTGVRSNKAKLKGFLEIGNFFCVTLVRGSLIWRGTDVATVVSLNHIQIQKENRPSFLRLLLLVQKLVAGEERNESLFNSLESLFMFLDRKIYTKNTLTAVECLGAIRILKALGYGYEFHQNIAQDGNISEADVAQVLIHRKYIVKAINKALKESHL